MQSHRTGRGRARVDPFAYETEPDEGIAISNGADPVGGAVDDVSALAASGATMLVGAEEPPEDGDMDAIAPPPAWTTDGYPLTVPPWLVSRILPRWRRYGRRYRRPARRLAIRRLARLTRNARRIGTLRHRRTGSRLPVFRSRLGRRSYRMVARPRGRRFELQLVRPIGRTADVPGGGWADRETGSAGVQGRTPSPSTMRKYVDRVRRFPQTKQPLLLTITFHPRPLESSLPISIQGFKGVPLHEAVRRHASPRYSGFAFLEDLRRIRDDFQKRAPRPFNTELRIRKAMYRAAGLVVRNQLMKGAGTAVDPKLRPFMQEAARAKSSGELYQVGFRFAQAMLPETVTRRIRRDSQVPEAHFTNLGHLLRRYAEIFKQKGYRFDTSPEMELERTRGGGSGSPGGGVSCSGWESDPQSFSRVIAKHHIRVETGKPLEVKHTTQVSKTGWRVDFPKGIVVYVTLSRVPDLVAAARWYPKPAGKTRYYTYTCPAKGGVVFRERGRP